MARFRTWKTVTLGTHASAEALLKTLTNDRFFVASLAADILKKTALSFATVNIPLVKVSPRKLGFDKLATRAQIFTCAAEFGLDPVPAEVGPQLLRQYPGQPADNVLYIGMEPIADHGGSQEILRVARYRGADPWLSTCNGDAKYLWDPNDPWIFTPAPFTPLH